MSEIDWKARAEAAEAREAVLRREAVSMFTAVTYAGKRDFGTPEEPNVCWEARIPPEFVDRLEAAITSTAEAAAARDARIRDEGRREGIEEAAGVATSPKHVAPVCPYVNDQPGDPTWTHTDKDVCPVCKKTGENSAGHCTVYVGGRISTAIRALLDKPAGEDGR